MSVLIVSRYLVALLGWAGTLIIVRYLSPSAWGGFSFVFSLLGIVGILSDLQVSRVVLRAILNADDPGRVVGSYLTLRIVFGILAYILTVTAILSGGYPQEIVLATIVAGMSLLLASPNAALRLFFESRLWLHPAAIAAVLGQVAQLILTVGIATSGSGTVASFTVPAVLFEAVILAVQLLAVRRVVRIRLSVNLGEWWYWIREALPLALGWALATVYYRVDMVMLSQLDTLTSVGLYGVGYKFADLIGFLSDALLVPALTLLVAAWPDNPAVFRRVFRHTFVVLCIIAAGVTVGFAGVALPMIELLYGSRFGAAAWAARGLVAGQAMHFFTGLAFATLVAIGRRRLFPVAMLVGLIVNVATNLWLIPRYSYNGAALATIFTELLVLVILSVALLRIGEIHPIPIATILRTTLASMLMAAVFIVLRGRLPWFAIGIVAGALYLGALHLLRVAGPGGLIAIIRNAPRAPTVPSEGPMEAGSNRRRQADLTP
jgi:O-antigen/teichoic acid export membrane protein